jgi:short-subunit dehydrogenase
MSRDLRGKRVILTGASGGIGRATAVALVRAGARVVLAARSGEALAELSDSLSKIGGVVTAISADVTRPDDRQRLVDGTVQAFGGLDLLINNAGIGSWGHFSTSSEAILRQVMEVNFFAPVELTRLAVPQLMLGSSPAVVNVTSMCGRKGMPAWPEYSASKFALLGMSEAWRGELVRFNIDVITIVPGLTDSGFQNRWLRHDGKAALKFAEGMKPETVAAGIVHAIEKNRTEVVLGREARRLLAFNRFFPRLTNWLIARKVKQMYTT